MGKEDRKNWTLGARSQMLVTIVGVHYQRSLQESKKTYWPIWSTLSTYIYLHSKICISKLFVLISPVHIRPHRQEASAAYFLKNRKILTKLSLKCNIECRHTHSEERVMVPCVCFIMWRDLRPVDQTHWGFEPHTLSLILFYHTAAVSLTLCRGLRCEES